MHLVIGGSRVVKTSDVFVPVRTSFSKSQRLVNFQQLNRGAQRIGPPVKNSARCLSLTVKSMPDDSRHSPQILSTEAHGKAQLHWRGHYYLSIPLKLCRVRQTFHCLALQDSGSSPLQNLGSNNYGVGEMDSSRCYRWDFLEFQVIPSAAYIIISGMPSPRPANGPFQGSASRNSLGMTHKAERPAFSSTHKSTKNLFLSTLFWSFYLRHMYRILFADIHFFTRSEMRSRLETSLLFSGLSIFCVCVPFNQDDVGISSPKPRSPSNSLTNSSLKPITRNEHGLHKGSELSFPDIRPKSPTPSPIPSNIPHHSNWSVEAIATMIFGCVASILGVITVGATLQKARQHHTRIRDNGTLFCRLGQGPSSPVASRKRFTSIRTSDEFDVHTHAVEQTCGGFGRSS